MKSSEVHTEQRFYITSLPTTLYKVPATLYGAPASSDGAPATNAMSGILFLSSGRIQDKAVDSIF